MPRTLYRSLLLTLLFNTLPVAHAKFAAELLAQATPLQRCQIATLEELGVEFTTTNGATNLQLGDLCRAEGATKLAVEVSASEVGTFLAKGAGDLFLQNSIKCAYKLQMERAALATAEKLQANDQYHFRSCAPTFAVAPEDQWEAQGRCIVAKQSPTQAMNCFTSRECYSECAVGQQVTQLATMAELFGELDFDRSFNRDEIVLGPWGDLLKSFNPFSGRDDVTYPLKIVKDPTAQTTAKQGRLFLVGASGYLGSITDEYYLHSPVDRGENFFILSAGQKAAEALAQHSFTRYNAINRQAQSLFAKYLGEEATPAAAMQLFRHNKSYIAELNALLDDPVYNQITVFVHPLGIMTLGDHVRRLLMLNPNAIYEFSLYENNLNTFLYERYIHSKISSCLEDKEKIPQIKVGSAVVDDRNRTAKVTHVLAGDNFKILIDRPQLYSTVHQSQLDLIIPSMTTTIQEQTMTLKPGMQAALFNDWVFTIVALTQSGRVIGKLESGKVFPLTPADIKQVAE